MTYTGTYTHIHTHCTHIRNYVYASVTRGIHLHPSANCVRPVSLSPPANGRSRPWSAPSEGGRRSRWKARAKVGDRRQAVRQRKASWKLCVLQGDASTEQAWMLRPNRWLSLPQEYAVRCPCLVFLAQSKTVASWANGRGDICNINKRKVNDKNYYYHFLKSNIKVYFYLFLRNQYRIILFKRIRNRLELEIVTELIGDIQVYVALDLVKWYSHTNVCSSTVTHSDTYIVVVVVMLLFFHPLHLVKTRRSVCNGAFFLIAFFHSFLQGSSCEVVIAGSECNL